MRSTHTRATKLTPRRPSYYQRSEASGDVGPQVADEEIRCTASRLEIVR
jgi:hypothetical protein